MHHYILRQGGQFPASELMYEQAGKRGLKSQLTAVGFTAEGKLLRHQLALKRASGPRLGRIGDPQISPTRHEKNWSFDRDRREGLGAATRCGNPVAALTGSLPILKSV